MLYIVQKILRNRGIVSLMFVNYFIGIFKRAFGRSKSSTQKSAHRDLKDCLVLDVCQTCEMYQVLAATLTQLKMEIFAGSFLKGE